ncbi:MAG: Low-affinity inorganic phosphate transporter 1 [Syntrophaceae bacterium PtaB.Bin038]|jgi:PiT family inorganic phosphate transporter|nr:MAG: Low-affinity inorganic phosphate transporter 1 [Syntrophaceae bacterium PtaB.Bin038]
MLDPVLASVIFLIVIALAFDFINGFHDAANSISCIVSTRVLSPKHAVYWAAFFNFMAAFIVGTPVAKTIGVGIIDPVIIDYEVLLCALIAAIAWNLITWWLGLPSSSSHALIGGLIGAGLTKGGMWVLVWQGIIKTAAFIVLSPTIGFVLGFLYMLTVLNLTKKFTVTEGNNVFRRLQLVSSAIHSMGHGMNDAQKTMGIITMVLFSSGYLHGDFHVPLWVVFACYITIALGTMAGGWRIVKTMGTKITKLHPMGGFCAETAAASSLIGATLFGIPVSTTHTITGAIMGVGATRRVTAVRWGIAGNILWAWVLTIPISALISAAAFYIID